MPQLGDLCACVRYADDGSATTTRPRKDVNDLYNKYSYVLFTTYRCLVSQLHYDRAVVYTSEQINTLKKKKNTPSLLQDRRYFSHYRLDRGPSPPIPLQSTISHLSYANCTNYFIIQSLTLDSAFP